MPAATTPRSSCEPSCNPYAATAPRNTAIAAPPNAPKLASGWFRAIRPMRSPLIASAVSRAPNAGSAARRKPAAPLASFPIGRNLGMTAQVPLRACRGKSTWPNEPFTRRLHAANTRPSYSVRREDADDEHQTRHEPLARPRDRLLCAFHGRARGANRQRRPPVYPAVTSLLALEPAVDRQRLHARLRRLSPPRWTCCGSLREAAAVRRRRDRVHRSIAPERAGVDVERPHRRSSPARTRRGARLPRNHLPPDHDP